VIDLEVERERLKKELQQVEKELRRAEGKLQNPSFLKKAPRDIVAKEKARLEEGSIIKEKLKERIRELQ
ncbi:MAG: hypothetical protein GX878_03255, partial [Firmicutes bacterium]|nr:hypothetical protein [Bacillota bacterium]